MRRLPRMQPNATLIVGTSHHPLEQGEPVIVPSGAVIVELEGVSALTAVRMDGRSPRIAWNPRTRRATLAVDLKRDTGFHELIVGPATFMFGTEDAKLRIDGMVELLDYLQAHGLSWSGAMFFSGSEQILRDARLDRAWLARRGNEIVALGTAIAERPWTTSRSRRRRTDHGVPDVGATLKLLRERPDLLEEMEDGPVEFEHGDATVKRYAPREVIVRERKAMFDTPGNRRMTALLDGVAALARSTQIKAPKHIRKEMAELVEQVERLLLRSPFNELRRRGAHLRLPLALAVEERIDPRYAAAREMHRELVRERHWDPRREVMPERAYAGHADAIYQRFCGHLLADHLGLEPTAELPGEGKGPHFAGDRFELYVDVTPPSSVIHNWREDSDREANLRPDLVLRERSTGRVALMDAKYRADRLRATLDSLAEVQLYLQTYSRKRVGILFPPGPGPDEQRWKAHEVTDGTFCIYELPFLPEARMASFLSGELDPVIELLLDD
jgi:hypothetical protein